ncbi:MAG: PilN domain-containing protein [Candidatus Omnitrophota bacterium]
MNKIYINLHPRQEKSAAPVAQKLAAYLPLVVAAAAIIFALIVIIALVGFMRFGVYRTQQSQWKQWEQKAAELGAIKKNIATLQAEKKELIHIVTPRVDIVQIFEGIYGALPENIWLENLTYRKDSLRLRGYVLYWKEETALSLDKLINALKKNEYFSIHFKKVALAESQKSSYHGVDVLEFLIECVIK